MTRRHDLILLLFTALVGCRDPVPVTRTAPVTMVPDAPPRELFEPGPGSRPTQCWTLGPQCAAPVLKAAETLGSPAADCEARVRALHSLSELDRNTTGAEDDYTRGDGWSEERLTDELISLLGLDRWPTAERRPLTAYGPDRETPVPGGIRTEWILSDPVLGAQRLLMHRPTTPGPHRLILALPGHQESTDEFMELRGGNSLLGAGYAVLLPVFKAYDSDNAEDTAWRALFCRETSLLAYRVLEIQNVLRWVVAQPGLLSEVGMVGHSGGSALGNVLVRLSPAVQAYAMDMTSIYMAIGDRGPEQPALILDESHPGLRTISDRIGRFEGSPPVIELDYGFPDGGVELVRFFQHQLPLPAPASPDEPPPPAGAAAVEDLGDEEFSDPRPMPEPGGTLSRRIELLTSSSSERSCRDLAAADLDGDGREELALATDDEPDRVWELEDGVLIERWVGPDPTIARGVSWGDIDGDGDPDLAFGVNNGPAAVFRNVGGELEPMWSGPAERLSKGIALVDLDGDGDLDLVLPDSSFDEFVRNDSGELTRWRVVPFDRRHEDAIAVDIDGDGVDEVAFAVSQNEPPNVEVWESVDGKVRNLELLVPPGPRTSALAAADVDGNGQVDLALARPGSRDTLLVQKDGAFAVTWTSEAAVQTRVVTFWDADRDGDPDLVLGEDGPLALYENDGGSFTLAWRSAERDDTEGLTTADVDGDGHPELVTCAQKGAPLRVYRSMER